MADIIDKEEIDKDTVDLATLDQQFSKHYKLLVEKAVSLKKSYINKLSGTKSLKLAVSQSDNSIEVYQLNSSSLNKVCRLSGHDKLLTELVFSPDDDHCLYSTGEDGVIKLWDTRCSGSCSQEFKEEEPKPYECLDISCNGRALCAGSQLVQDDAFLVFWDTRQPGPLGGYWNCHTDDVTQVKFHKTKPHILASGSSDGLLNIFDITESTEDEALQYSLNTEKAVERISWLYEDVVGVVTQCDNVQIWDAKSGDALLSYDREKIARSIKRSKDDDCYVVDMFSVDDSAVILAGSSFGDGECLRSLTVSQKRLQPRTNFKSNKQIVRCSWYCEEKDILVTAGESGEISVWSQGADEADDTKLTKDINKLRVNRHKPY